MATIDDILNKKKPDVVQTNKDDNPANSRGERAPISNTPQGVQAPEQKKVDVAPGLNPKDMKPLPANPTAPAPKTEPTAPVTPPKEEKAPAAPVTPATQKVEEPKTETTPTVEEHVEEHKENTKPQKPQPSEPRQRYTYEDIEAMMGETEEQKKAREKREKREAVLATLADGFAAFHNAYSHARGTQPMQNIGGNSSKLAQRLYQEQKDREAKGLKLYDMKQRAEQMKQNQALWDKRLEFYNKQEERRVEAQNLEYAKQEWKMKADQGKLDGAAEERKIKRDLADSVISKREHDMKMAELKLQVERQKANSQAELNKAKTENERNKNNVTTETVQDRKDAYGGTTQTHTKKTTTVNAPAQQNRQESANGTPQNNSGGVGSAGKYDKYKQTQKKDYSQYKVK